MKRYQLSDMMNALGFENTDNICMRRKEVKDRLGIHTYDNNLRSISKVMDFKTGRFDDFTLTCLVVADRLFEYGVGLAYYLQTNTCATILGVIDEYKSNDWTAQDIDFIIFCGYQKNETNYQIIWDMRKKANPPHIIMVAHLDNLIKEICRQYNIIYAYDRSRCLSDFINYLTVIQHHPKIRITEEKELTYEKEVNKLVDRNRIMDAILNILRNPRQGFAKNL